MAFVVRRMTRSDLDTAMQWASGEGWNPGANDADAFWAADPQGFFAGVLDGRMVASISAVTYGEHYGFIGLYIVKPGWRGRDFGIRVWRAAMAYLGGRSAGLDGVIAQQSNYRRSGFEAAWRDIRFEGVGGAAAPAEAIDLSHVPFDELLAYDTGIFAFNRRAFLRTWVCRTGVFGCAARRDGKLVGYGVIRPSERGFKIGPLFADNAIVAEELFRALVARAPGSPVFLDVPEINGPAMELARRFGMNPMFECARMYAGRPPAVDVPRVFGVTSLELG